MLRTIINKASLVVCCGLASVALATNVVELLPSSNQPAPAASSTPAVPAPITEGKDYLVLPTEIKTKAVVQDYISAQPTDRVWVTEFFSLGCPACYTEEKYLAAWYKNLDPQQVLFQRASIRFHPEWTDLSNIYYAAEQMQLTAELTPVLFWEIHMNGTHPDNVKEMDAVLLRESKKLKFDLATFNQYRNSEAAKQLIQDNMSLLFTLGLRSTPSFLVNGKYLVVAGADLQGQRLVDVLKYVVGKEVEARAAAKPNGK